jgi:hypothetical protein
MKKIGIAIFALLISTLSIAQNNKGNERLVVDFYGVDFSTVNVVGASETDDKFLIAFDGINGLMLSEPRKYNVGKFLNLDVASTDITEATKQIDKLEGVDFKNKKQEDIPLKEILNAYPTVDANILIIVAKELNKGQNMGHFMAVVFDGETKEIISKTNLSGKAAGFGLRNFWAGSLFKAMKAYRPKRK